MNGRQIDRRKFLGRLGLGAGAGALAPLFPLMDSEAEAAGGPPLRFVVFWNGTGNCHHDAWRPTGTETSFTLSDVLSPLQPFKSQLVVIEGLENKAATAAGVPVGHGTQVTMALTGAPGGAGSIDQRIADAIRGSSPFHSLLLKSSPGGLAHMSSRGSGQDVPAEGDPQATFNRLFPGSFTAPPPGPNPGPPPDPQKAARELNARRRRIFDAVVKDTQRAKTVLGAEGYQKIDKYRVGLEDVIKRLELLTDPGSGTGSGPTGGTATCTKPTVNFNGSPTDRAQYVPVGRLNQLLASAALACDRTRVALLQWGAGGGGGAVPDVGVVADVNGTNSYHQLGHFAFNNKSATEQPINGYPGNYPQLKRNLQKFYAKELASFLSSLASYRESNGTLLDNTLVYWANGMTRGGHAFGSPGIPVVLMVGKNVASAAGLSMGTGGGRFLTRNGTSHVQLLTSLGHIMGLKDSGAPLPGLV